MASPNLVEFTSDTWQKEVLESALPVVVDFWAPWCGPCRALTPTIEKLATTYAGKVKVGKLNIDDAQDIASTYGVTSIPRVFIFKKGTLKGQFVGVTPESELSKAIDKAMQEA